MCNVFEGSASDLVISRGFLEFGPSKKGIHSLAGPLNGLLLSYPPWTFPPF
jgi:hypothetical protein